MEDGRRSALFGTHKGVSEIPDAGSRVAEDESLTAADFDTGGVSPVAPPDGERKLPVDKSPDLLIGRKITRPGCTDRPEDLLADLSCCRRRGQRSARSPEIDVHPLTSREWLHARHPRCTPANMLIGSCLEPGLRTHRPLSAGLKMDHLF